MQTIVFNKIILAVAVSLLAIWAIPAIANTQPARAHEGHEHAQEQREAGQLTAQQMQEEARERVELIKQEVEERRETIKQEVCERRQQQLTQVMPRLATGATSVKSAFDTIYSRVQGFYESGQLTVSNYDELKAEVDAAQAEAAVALAAVDSYEFELDCENANVGEQLDGFRTAVSSAKESLKAYRQALVNLISALRAEAAEEAQTNADEEETEEETTEEEETSDEQ